jgi:WD40 repeat protein
MKRSPGFSKFAFSNGSHLYRYSAAPAHVGAVAAIETDGSNKQVITGGAADGVVRVWNFASQHLKGEMDTVGAVQFKCS